MRDDLTGYGWCFRKENILNVGLGRADPHRVSTHAAEFLRFLRLAGRICFDVPPRQTVDDCLLLIGDAAGVAYPQSGEGILPAIEFGLRAAKSIVAAQGRFTKEQLEACLLVAERRRPWATTLRRYLPKQVINPIA